MARQARLAAAVRVLEALHAGAGCYETVRPRVDGSAAPVTTRLDGAERPVAILVDDAAGVRTGTGVLLNSRATCATP